MSRRKTEETDEIIEEGETPKETPKQNNSSKKDDGTLHTLYDLAMSSEFSRSDVVFVLSRKGYLNQFYDEELKRDCNEFVEPTMTEAEFRKIMGG